MADIAPNLPLNKRRLELQLAEARTSLIRQDVKIMELRDEIAKIEANKAAVQATVSALETNIAQMEATIAQQAGA